MTAALLVLAALALSPAVRKAAAACVPAVVLWVAAHIPAVLVQGCALAAVVLLLAVLFGIAYRAEWRTA